MDRDEVLVKLVEHESIIWKRNHPQFKNVTMKEQAWARVSYQLGISSESLFAHKHIKCVNFSFALPLNIISQFSDSSFPHKFRVNPITNSHSCTLETNFDPSIRAYQLKCVTIFIVVTQKSLNVANIKRGSNFVESSVCE